MAKRVKLSDNDENEDIEQYVHELLTRAKRPLSFDEILQSLGNNKKPEHIREALRASDRIAIGQINATQLYWAPSLFEEPRYDSLDSSPLPEQATPQTKSAKGVTNVYTSPTKPPSTSNHLAKGMSPELKARLQKSRPILKARAQPSAYSPDKTSLRQIPSNTPKSAKSTSSQAKGADLDNLTIEQLRTLIEIRRNKLAQLIAKKDEDDKKYKQLLQTKEFDNLDELISKWKQTVQSLLNDATELARKAKAEKDEEAAKCVKLKDALEYFQINPKLVDYNSETDDFES